MAAAYQVALPVSVTMGRGPIASHVARDLHAPEAGFRWSRGTGRLEVPGPGPYRRVLVDVTLSAWRPRGQPLPQVAVSANGARVVVGTTPRPAAVRVEAKSRGAWSGAVELRLTSPDFQPSLSDTRRLGVRVHQVRVAAPSVFSPGLPPLRPLLLERFAEVETHQTERR